MRDVVYYLRRNGLIKIGWSGNLKARMRALRPDELLAVEPGCMHIETGRHHQFAEHRLPSGPAGDEWFNPAPELLGHIELIARMYPTPSLAELMPRPRSRPPRRSSVELLTVITPDDVATLRRVHALRHVDIEAETETDDALVAHLRDATRAHEISNALCRQYLVELKKHYSWSEMVALTGDPQSTLYNRANPRRRGETSE